MGLQRRVQRAQAQRGDEARKEAFRGAQQLVRESTYYLSLARLKIAVAHAAQSARDSEVAFRKYPNRETFSSFKRAVRQLRRAGGMADAVAAEGRIILRPYPASQLYGEFFAHLVGRARDETLLFFLEEERFGGTLCLELRK